MQNGKISKGDNAFYTPHLRFIQILPDLIARKQHHRIRMVNNMVNVVGLKVG